MATREKKKFTVRELAQSPDKPIWLYDPTINQHGELCARVTKNGAHFYFRYQDPEKKRTRISLGKFHPKDLSLEKARDKASELSRIHREITSDVRGYLDNQKAIEVDTQHQEVARIAAAKAQAEADRRAAEIESSRLTVKQLFERWEKAYLEKNHKDKGADTRRLFEKDVLKNKLAEMPAHLVRKGDVMELVDTILERGAERVAQRIFSSLRQMFRYAVARDFIETDPTLTIPKTEICAKSVERDRVLSDDEIKALAKQIPSAGMLPTTEAAIWIALATGCRIGELLKAQWEYVDFDKQQWQIPAENSKNGIPLTVELSDFALKQFRVVEQYRNGIWLYPARNQKKLGDHVSTKTITKQIGDRQRTKAMKNRSAKTATLTLPGGRWHMHDLRRTASTIMGDLGIKPEVIDRCQNHVEQNRIRRTYQRYSYQVEMRQAWQLLGERLEALTNAADAAKLIPISRSGVKA